MTTLKDFREKPATKLAPLYEHGFLNLHRSPENSTSDFLLGSLYRSLGLVPVGNDDVSSGSRKFKANLRLGMSRAFPARTSPSGMDDETWQFLVNGTLAHARNSPRSSLIFLDPIIPHIACISTVARTSGNWNAGEFIRGMVVKGSPNPEHASKLWKKFSTALSIEEGDGNVDDLWAIFLGRELQEWLPDEAWVNLNDSGQADINNASRPKPIEMDLDFGFPAREFCQKAKNILNLKYSLTRKQWIALIDSFLRISCVSDALWTCEMNARVFSMAKEALAGGQHNEAEINSRLQAPLSFLQVGEHLENCLKEQCRDYVKARTGLNFILFKMAECKETEGFCKSGAFLNSVSRVRELLENVGKIKDRLSVTEINTFTSEIIDSNPALTKLDKSGAYSINLYWFCRYVLGQFTPKDKSKKHLDQGFFGKKSAEHDSAPWLVELGTNAVLAMVACCAQEGFQVTTVDLRDQLSKFGVVASIEDLTEGNIGKQLRGLGLVVDSPDAEGGMAISFPYSAKDE